MPARRSHTKSRNGCMQCKKRHIKCDEAKPACSNCLGHNETTCTYPVNKAASKANLRDASDSPKTDTGIIDFNDNSRNSAAASSSATTASPLSLDDLQLLHHWSTVTYSTVTPNPAQHHVLQVIFPQLGMKHPFLMHGILAFAALHLSVCNPNQHHEFVVKAIAHQNAALSSYRKDLGNVTANNYEGVCAFACILTGYSFALPQYSQLDAAEMLDSTLHSLQILRGINIVLAPWFAEIISSQFGALLPFEQLFPKPGQPLPPPPPGLYTLAHVADPVKASIFRDAIEGMLRLFYDFLVKHIKLPASVLLIWPGTVSEQFVELLQARDANALAIFAYFGALLHQNDVSWPLEGWGGYVVKCICTVLGSQWDSSLSWARKAVGLEPGDLDDADDQLAEPLD